MKWLSKLFKKKDINGIPWHIVAMGKLIKVLDSEGNVAKGEIEKFNFCESDRNKPRPFNQQLVGTERGYHWIWRYIADDYFKVVGKWPEDPWTCQ